MNRIVFNNVFNNQVIRKQIFDYISLIHLKCDQKVYKWNQLILEPIQLVKYKYYRYLFTYLKVIGYNFIKSDIEFCLESLIKDGNLEAVSYIFRNLKHLHSQVKLVPKDLDLSNLYIKSAFYGRLEIIKLDIIQWLLDNDKDQLIISYDIIDHIAGYGHLDIVEFLWSKAAVDKLKISDIAMTSAAVSGNLELLQWLFKNNNNPKIKLGNIIDQAAKKGHLNIIQWIHEQQVFLVEKYKIIPSRLASTMALDWATAGNHMEVAQWLKENRTEGCGMNALYYVVGNGHWEMSQWLVKNCGHVHYDIAATIKRAIQKKNLQIFKFLLDYDIMKNYELYCELSSMFGSLEILEYILEETEIDITEKLVCELMYNSVKSNEYDILIYLLKLFPEVAIPIDIIRESIKRGNIDIVTKLIIRNAMQWDLRCLEKSIKYDKYNITLWLLQHQPDNLYKLEELDYAHSVSKLLFEFKHLPSKTIKDLKMKSFKKNEKILD
ncbi:hypothetical protein PPL_03705 [Heterostelium album PN500]|uniref:Ankyrin repeat protein n=1 Tax=Heterostelium pallidum (strain ATCC 26659 / Pp 5 / PN500) TaxID=670386 RepID=D3B6F7_HETP5|nr:hypothetical protein PPL_03705 [Heterostelium album PN500]EFA82927.1 hypothetical protein PPL_03705 [Heterostelium album PN500]|eukprot:XP_020435044.1 hypothetical protein PPL_03705 [Heterostelium album PN500]